MSNTDRKRVYYNIREKCFSVQDYQSGLVIEHTDKLFVTNAMFVVRKSGNERVKQEGKKNVHAFVNGIRSKLKQGMMPEFASYKVRYDPYTMDYFHYERIVNDKPKWLPVDRHWIGNVYLYMNDGKPIIYADIDKWGDNLSDEKLSGYTFDKVDRKVLQELADFRKELFPNNIKNKDFLIRKQRQINNKKKLLAI